MDVELSIWAITSSNLESENILVFDSFSAENVKNHRKYIKLRWVN